MRYKANEIKAGIIVVTSLAVLLIFLFAIWGVRLGEKTHEYTIYFQYVGGITEGSLVKFRGIDVGWVKEIKLPGNNEPYVEVRIEVAADTPIRKDSQAFITAIGLMREDHVEITAGSLSQPFLPPGSVIPSKEVMNFARIAEVMGEVSADLKVLISRVADVFNDDNRQRFASMMDRMDSLFNEGSQPLQKSLNNLEALTLQMNQLVTNLNTIAATTDRRLDSILINLQSVTKRTDTLVTELNGTFGSMNTMLSSNQLQIQQIVNNLRDVTRNLDEFTRQVKERPWMLIRKSAPPERKLP